MDFDEVFIRIILHNSAFFLIIVVGNKRTAYETGDHLLGHDPALDL